MKNTTPEVTTIEQAREAIGDMIHIHGEAEVRQHICTALNCREVMIGENAYAGNVWIENPQVGHWLSDDKIIELVNTINKGV